MVPIASEFGTHYLGLDFGALVHPMTLERGTAAAHRFLKEWGQMRGTNFTSFGMRQPVVTLTLISIIGLEIKTKKKHDFFLFRFVILNWQDPVGGPSLR